VDISILEYKDVFRLQPVMPLPGMLDPGAIKRAFEVNNAPFKGLDWEIEDLIPANFVAAFLSEHPGAVARTMPVGGKVHRDFTPFGKAAFIRFVKEHSVHSDLVAVVETLRAMRTYLNLPTQSSR
jgi:hypothetical protein